MDFHMTKADMILSSFMLNSLPLTLSSCFLPSPIITFHHFYSNKWVCQSMKNCNLPITLPATQLLTLSRWLMTFFICDLDPLFKVKYGHFGFLFLDAPSQPFRIYLFRFTLMKFPLFCYWATVHSNVRLILCCMHNSLDRGTFFRQ